MAKKNSKENKVKNAEAKSMKSELKKVSWPNAETLSKSTAAVLFLVITVAVIIFISDAIFNVGSKKFSEYIMTRQGQESLSELLRQNIENVETTEVTSENAESNEENKEEANTENEEKTENTENTENKEETTEDAGE